MLLTSSLDSSVHVYLLSSILDPAGDTPKPYGTLADHTLAITDVVVGRTASVNGGRCWTASEDGTVKLWSLSAPFDLLATFSFPPSVTPTTIAVEPVERFFYVGSAQGSIYHIPLYKRRGEIGDMDASIEAIGGGIGAPIKTDGSVLSYP
jgi:pre-rRNA-processing protein IPI3